MASLGHALGALAITASLAAATLTAPAAGAEVGTPVAADPVDAVTSLLVKYETGAPVLLSDGSVNGEELVPQAELTGVTKAANGISVVSLGDAVAPDEAAALADQLAQDPQVAWAEPNTRLQPLAFPVDPPDDVDFGKLWGLWDADYGTQIGTSATQLTEVWGATQGAGVTVAVIDTGVIAHPDLDGQTVPGYDFVSSDATTTTANRYAGSAYTGSSDNDGDVLDTSNYGAAGRDDNPLDPGDWKYASGSLKYSSWHGTHVAGTIAAKANNATGVTGLAPLAKVQPIRALGWAGGQTSDIADAIVWASGGTVPGVPANTTPAKVINMSLGGTASCSDTMQKAIDTAIANGSVVVVAAGNENADVSTSTPANCAGVIAVGATTRAGTRASYSNYGAGVTVSAPGGDATNGIYSTLSSTPTGPGAPQYAATPVASYGFMQGTSMAAPHVSAVAALIKSANPTWTPAQVKTRLAAKTRPLATGGCTTPATSCGAGIVTARAALPDPTITSVAPSSGPAAGGTSVTITGANLSRTTAVKFGTEPVSFVVGGGATVTASSPPGTAGAVAVTVTTSNGTATLSSAFTYVAPAPAPPAPAPPSGGGSSSSSSGDSGGGGGGALQEITGLRPASGPLSGGNQVAIVGFGFTGASQVLIGGKPASYTVVNDAHVDVTMPPGDAIGAVDVSVVLSPARGRAFAAGGYVYTPDVVTPAPAPAPQPAPTALSATEAIANPAGTIANPPAPRPLGGGVLLLSQRQAAGVAPTVMRQPVRRTVTGSPIVRLTPRAPLRLTVRGLPAGLRVRLQVAAGGRYVGVGTGTATASGTLTAPAVSFATARMTRLRLVTSAGTWYARIAVGRR